MEIDFSRVFVKITARIWFVFQKYITLSKISRYA